MIAPLFGLYHMNMNFGFSVYMIVMQNVFDHPEKALSTRYDLKGSFVNRKAKAGASLKLDRDLKEYLLLSEETLAKLTNQLKIDSEVCFLIFTI